MNKPEFLLKDSLFWNKNESSHFLYYSSKNISRDLLYEVAIVQEDNLNHIASIMNVSHLDTLRKIQLWIFESEKEKYIKTQVKASAHTLTEYWSTYYIKSNATSAHEVAHLMSQHFWGYLPSKKYSFLLEEGFAFYIDEFRFHKVDFYKEAKRIFQHENFKIEAIVLGNDEGDYKSKAIVCGAFVKYLITTFGIEKFSELWKNISAQDAFKAAYNKDLFQLENEFYEWLSSH